MAENLPSVDFFMAGKLSTFDFFIITVITALKHYYLDYYKTYHC
jgi:hypothetical protein